MTPSFQFASLVPENERDHAWHLQLQVNDVAGYINRFDEALALFDYAESAANELQRARMPDNASAFFINGNFSRERRNEIWANNRETFNRVMQFNGWQNIAGRDACFTITHLMDTLEAIKSGLTRCPSLGKLVMGKSIDAIKAGLLADFPYYRVLRDAVAHPADLAFRKEKFEKNATDEHVEIAGYIKNDGKNLMISPHMMGRSIVATKEKDKTGSGEAYTMEIFTEDTRKKLLQVQEAIFSEFEPAQEKLKEAYLAQRRARFESNRETRDKPR